MNYFLLKTEPSTYSFSDLQREKTTVWSGVANAAALIHIRSMQKGDMAMIYHTGTERACIGTAQITSNAYPDPEESNEKLVVVDLKVKKPLKRPVKLDEFKADKTFAKWDLLRISRLSVVPTHEKLWHRILELSDK